jgi:hypothetical protein
VLRVLKETGVIKVPRVTWETMDPREIRVTKDHTALREYKVPWAQPVIKVYLVLQRIPEQRDA